MRAMSLKAQIQSDVSIFLNTDEMAEIVLYNGAQISAIVDYGEDMGAGNAFSSDGQAAKARVYVAAADVQDPQQGDTIVIHGGTWTVARKTLSDGVMHLLECTANESPW